MKRILFSIVVFTPLLCLFGCSVQVKSSPQTDLPAQKYDIYVAGRETNRKENLPAIKIWKNGVSMYHNQPNGEEGINDYYSDITSVFVSGNDVYAAGNENRNGRSPGAAVVWKNGVPLYDHENNGSKSLMPADREFSVAEDIVVSGEDVYVLGMNSNGRNSDIVNVWKNGELLYDIKPSNEDTLSDITKLLGFSMFVSGDDIYVAGDKRKGNVIGGTEGFANVWKNGKSLYYNGPDGAEGLSEIGSHNIAPSVFVSGDDVYAAGGVWRNGREIAMVWKNGRSLYNNGINGAEGLTDGKVHAFVHSIFVSGDDVYAAGEYYFDWERRQAIAMVWKNGKPLYRNGFNGMQGLTGGKLYSRARSIFIVGDDVFVAGESWELEKGSRLYGDATVWMNGVVLYRQDGKSKKDLPPYKRDSQAVSIFVVPRN